VSVLLGCDALVVGFWFQTFQDDVAVSFSSTEMSKKNVFFFLDASLLASETATLSQDFRTQIPTDAASHSRTDTSATTTRNLTTREVSLSAGHDSSPLVNLMFNYPVH
jgi:hypothetical protein